MNFQIWSAAFWFVVSAGLFTSVARMFVNDKRRERQQ